MSKAKTEHELIQHKTDAIDGLSKYMDDLINSGEEKNKARLTN